MNIILFHVDAVDACNIFDCMELVVSHATFRELSCCEKKILLL